MAQWNITHICGHNETHQLYGPGKDRTQRAKWLETTLCSDCYKAEQERQKIESAQIAAEENKESGLPALEGTDKQITWAETIRAKIKAEMDSIISQIVTTEPQTSEQTQSKEWAIEDAKIILRQKKAAYWIDNRGMTARSLLKRRYDKRIADKALS